MNMLLLVTAIVAFGLMLMLVPQDRIRRFFGFGIAGGLIIWFAVFFLMVTYLGLWQFNPQGLASVGGFSILLPLFYLPLVIVYAHYFPQSDNKVLMAAYLSAIPLGTIVFHWVLGDLGILTYANWSLAGTFFLAFFIHLALAFYLYIYQFKQTLNRV